MSTSFQLQALLDLAQTRTDEAAHRLGELVAAERDGAQQLKMLEQYRLEYKERFVEAARAGLSPDSWRNYSAFIARLDEAVAAQHMMLEKSRQHTAHGQQQWLEQRNKLKAFDTLAQRHHADLARQEQRQEQRIADEHAARQARTAFSSEC